MGARWRARVVVALVAALVGGVGPVPHAAPPVAAAPLPPVPGTPDPAFAGDGSTLVDAPPQLAADADPSAAPGPGGTALVVFAAVDQLVVQRLRPDGTADPTFGRQGTAATGVQGGEVDVPHIATLPDGSMLVWISVRTTCPGCFETRIAKLAPDGALDATYGSGGRSTVPAPGSAGAARGDGTLVLAGGSSLVAVSPTGALDPAFGTSGATTTPVVDDRARAAVALAADGDIVVAGVQAAGQGGLAVVARFDPSGHPRTSFGAGGVVTYRSAEQDVRDVPALGAEPAGGVVVAVDLGPPGMDEDVAVRAVLVRLRGDGTTDPSFGTLGSAVVSGTDDATATDVERRADGTYRVAYTVDVDRDSGTPRSDEHATVVAVGAAGAVTGRRSFDLRGAHHATSMVPGWLVGATSTERGFAVPGGDDPSGGSPPARFGVAQDVAESPHRAVARPDGSLLVVGGASGDGFVAHVRDDGTLDPGFGAAGVALVRDGIADDLAFDDVEVQPDGRVVAAAGPSIRTAASVVVTRLTPAGALDPSFGGDGTVRIPVAPTGSRVAVELDGAGRIVVGHDDELLRLRTDGSLDPTFGTGGRTRVPGITGLTDLEPRGTGWVIAASFTNLDAGLVAVDARGRPDPGFGTGGAVALHRSPTAVEALPDGRFVTLVSHIGGGSDVLMVSAAGALDPTFDVTTRLPWGLEGEPLDLVVAAGAIHVLASYNGEAYALRYGTDGSVDERYNDFAAPRIPDGVGLYGAIAVDASGRLTIAVGQRSQPPATAQHLALRRGYGGTLPPEPAISILDAAPTLEGTGTGGRLRFTIRLSAPSAVPVGVWITDVVPARPDLPVRDPDLLPSLGPFVFEPGVTQQVAELALVGDTTDEADETYVATIGRARYGVLGDTSASGTIVDDDGWDGQQPPAPRALTVQPGRGHVGVSWQPPAGEGHAAVVEWAVVAVRDGAFVAWLTVPGDTLSTSIADLRDGAPVDVYVAAGTTSGLGAWAGPVRATPTSTGAPVVAAPQPNVQAVLHRTGYVQVVLGPPVDGDGGAPITGYGVAVVDHATGRLAAWRIVPADARRISFEGLDDSRAYDVAIAASTSAGKGTPTTWNATTSPGDGGQPQRVGWIAALARPGAVVARWGPAAEEGRAVAGYSVVFVQDGQVVSWQNVGAGVRTATASGLARGRPVQVHVVPFSSTGFGEAWATPPVATPS